MTQELVYTEFGGGELQWADCDGLYIGKDDALVAAMADGTQVRMKAYDDRQAADAALAAILSAIEGGVEIIVIDDY